MVLRPQHDLGKPHQWLPVCSLDHFSGAQSCTLRPNWPGLLPLWATALSQLLWLPPPNLGVGLPETLSRTALGLSHFIHYWTHLPMCSHSSEKKKPAFNNSNKQGFEMYVGLGEIVALLHYHEGFLLRYEKWGLREMRAPANAQLKVREWITPDWSRSDAMICSFHGWLPLCYIHPCQSTLSLSLSSASLGGEGGEGGDQMEMLGHSQHWPVDQMCGLKVVRQTKYNQHTVTPLKTGGSIDSRWDLLTS